MKRISLGAAALVILIGCGKKLNMESTFDVPMEGKKFIVDPISSEQKIKVTAKAAEAPVSVYVYLQKKEEVAENEIPRGKSENLLAKEEKKESISLEATIPANEAAVVRVGRAGKATKVTLHITNR